MLRTPARRQPFWTGRITSDSIELELGEQRTGTKFPWPCLEGVVDFLRAHGEVPINGNGKNVAIVHGTLDGYLKQHVNRLTAGWVAVLLEKASVVEINRNGPGTVRLSNKFKH